VILFCILKFRRGERERVLGFEVTRTTNDAPNMKVVAENFHHFSKKEKRCKGKSFYQNCLWEKKLFHSSELVFIIRVDKNVYMGCLRLCLSSLYEYRKYKISYSRPGQPTFASS